MKTKKHYPLVLLGAGYANCLLAYLLKTQFEFHDFILLEKAFTLGEVPKTWSFHGSDIHWSPKHWITPLISHTWSTGYEVEFPKFKRHLPGTYHCILSEHFFSKLHPLISENLHLGEQVLSSSHKEIQLNNNTVTADLIMDGRGADSCEPVAFQKFVGSVISTKESHGVHRPLLMDVNVPQIDGFRFFYVLPFSEHKLLVEDTRYSRTPDLDTPQMRSEIDHYISQHWGHYQEEGHEEGVLPIPLSAVSPLPQAWGMRGSFFHFTTGYSTPIVVRLLTSYLENHSTFHPHTMKEWLKSASDLLHRQQHFFSYLNRILFHTEDDQRYKILESFYRLPTKTLQAFYRGELNLWNQIQIFLTRPPIPYGHLVRALFPQQAPLSSTPTI